MSDYGFCPYCCAPVELRERRPDGNDICENMHEYPTKLSTHDPDFAGSANAVMSALSGLVDSRAPRSYADMQRLQTGLSNICKLLSATKLAAD